MAESKKIDELKWITDVSRPLRPSIDGQGDFSHGEQRTFKKLVLKQMKENIFVPLGLGATTVCLTLGILNLRRGNSTKQQFFMRGRVLFQGLTLAAMTVGGFLTHQKNLKDQSEAQAKADL